MPADNTMPELKQIIGSLIFAARHPVTAAELTTTLVEIEEVPGGQTNPFRSVKEDQVRTAIEELAEDVRQRHMGFHIVEVAGGFKVQSDGNCGPWVRHMLQAGRSHRLSRPALETLAIIAYRQPITRAEIEAVRGVQIDHVLSVLMETQLVRIVGRSALPGRPMLYGTTKAFLEHFGLADTKDLPGIEELARAEQRARTARAAAPAAAPSPAPGTPVAAESPAAVAETETEEDEEEDDEFEDEDDEEDDDDEFEDDDDDAGEEKDAEPGADEQDSDATAKP